MSLIPIYSKEQVLAYIAAVELLKPDYYQSSNREEILKELIQFRVDSQQEAQSNISREEPGGGACGCMGGPKGCSMCNCELSWKAYSYRYHLYLHYFYPETTHD